MKTWVEEGLGEMKKVCEFLLEKDVSVIDISIDETDDLYARKLRIVILPSKKGDNGSNGSID